MAKKLGGLLMPEGRLLLVPEILPALSIFMFNFLLPYHTFSFYLTALYDKIL